MALWLLGLLVAGGISLIVYIVHAGGGSRPAVLADEGSVLGRWTDDFPEDLPLAIVMSADHKAAILQLKRSTGLIVSVGDRFLTRTLVPADVNQVTVDGSTLELQLNDFTYRGGRWQFETTEQANRAAAWLTA